MRFLFFVFLLSLASCNGQSNTSAPREETKKDTVLVDDAVTAYFKAHSANHNQEQSTSTGSVSEGTLLNGWLMPFSGKNFCYFDSSSYTGGRAFVNDRLYHTLLESYRELENIQKNRFFRLMECSNEHGGKIFPHRTHQNGLSVDLMTPLLKDSEPYYTLDSLGGTHYLLEFDKSGRYLNDPSVTIDFESIAQHILLLNRIARKHGMKISKVIFNTDLKDELLAGNHGKQLAASGIYITRQLTPMINALHDDHFHIDFEIID